MLLAVFLLYREDNDSFMSARGTFSWFEGQSKYVQ